MLYLKEYSPKVAHPEPHESCHRDLTILISFFYSWASSEESIIEKRFCFTGSGHLDRKSPVLATFKTWYLDWEHRISSLICSILNWFPSYLFGIHKIFFGVSQAQVSQWVGVYVCVWREGGGGGGSGPPRTTTWNVASEAFIYYFHLLFFLYLKFVLKLF